MYERGGRRTCNYLFLDASMSLTFVIKLLLLYNNMHGFNIKFYTQVHRPTRLVFPRIAARFSKEGKDTLVGTVGVAYRLANTTART